MNGGGQLEATARGYRAHVNESLARLASFLGSGLETRADGAYVYDESGRRFLDCGGFGVFLLGHRHPLVLAAVERQLRRQPLPTRLLLSGPLATAAERLARRAPAGLEYAYLTTSGAEAVELALKLSHLNGHRSLIAMEGGFHGKTLAALSLCGNRRLRDRFSPPLLDVDRVPFGDLGALEAALARAPEPAAVFLEPIQGEGGVRIPPVGYLSSVAAACRRHGALLVVDEIQTGLGRAGAWWAIDAERVEPDILLAGKSLSGGVTPVAALVASPRAFAPLSADAYLHSSTFGNNPQAAAAVLATLDTLEAEDVPARAAAQGERLLGDLREALRGPAGERVREVRGRGLLIGIELERAEDAGELVAELYARGVLATFTLADQRVVRLMPPVGLGNADLEWLVDAVAGGAEAIAATAVGVGHA